MSSVLSAFVSHFTTVVEGPRVRRILGDSWAGVSRSDELGALRSYLFDPGVGVDFLNSRLSPLLSSSKFQVKFAGVFCHKKPIVQRTPASIAINPGSTGGCELGDLLTVFVLLDSANVMHYLAGSLFQAKLYPKMTSSSQKHLYDDDLEFVLPANLGKHVRKMPTYSEGRGRALRYLILNQNFFNGHVGCRHTPWSADYQFRWSTYMYNLLSGSDGLRAKSPVAGNPSSWDIIVDDILSVAANVPSRKPTRGTDIAVKVATGHFNDFRSREIQAIVSDEPGVSVLMVIVHSNSEGED